MSESKTAPRVANPSPRWMSHKVAAADRSGSRRVDLLAWAVLFLGVAVMLRGGVYGNPLYGDDEPFYSFVGGRMAGGARVYIDVFDRKPFLLFAIFAAIRGAGGDAVLAPQLIATVFVAATAWMVAVLARARSPDWASGMAGLFYLVMACALGGMIAQTPIFYNLAIAAAAWLILRTAPALDAPGDVGRACVAMLLCGLSIQVKTNAAFEGAAFGLWLTARMWRARGAAYALPRGALLAGAGLAPTLLVGAGFWMAGEFHPWWFANFESQLRKTGGWDAESIRRLGDTALQSLPLLIAAGVGLARGPRDERSALLLAWTVAAVIDAVSIGNFWVHYALPLALVASILSARLWSIRWIGPTLFVAVFAPFAISQSTRYWPGAASSRVAFAKTLAAIPRDVRTRCMLGYETPAVYYDVTHACLVTPYIFIDELRSSAEAHALPVDASVALRQALARRPGTILTIVHSHWRARNRNNDAILAAALAQGYRRIAVIPERRWRTDPESVAIWRRADLIGVR